MLVEITHLTSVHPRYDTRVFFRECLSLAKQECYQVNLLVADNLGDECKSGVNIFDVKKLNGRFQRIVKTTQAMLEKALELDSDIYHFHDPELIFVGLKLKKFGKKVIFDVHEDTKNQIQNKFYIPKVFRTILAFLYGVLNHYIANKFHLVLAEKSYESIYKDKTDNYTTIQNFPNLEFYEPYRLRDRKKNGIFYIGEVSNERGLKTTIDALKILKKREVDFYMHYVGPIYNPQLLNNLDLHEIEDKIQFYGSMVLDKGFELTKECKVGLSVLEPVNNFKTSYSTKIFEYMAIGLPVITSDFPLYQDVVEKHQCGICINPLDTLALANAIERILTKEKSSVFGENGYRAVSEYYNWKKEEQKLLALYESLLK